MQKSNLIIFDFETTGLDPFKDEIIEIAAEKIKPDGELIENFYGLINPTIEVSYGAEQTHGITHEHLEAEGKEPKIIIPAFKEFIGQDVLVGHNIARFDLLFLKQHLEKLKLEELKNKYIDTLYMARQLLKGMPDYKLTTLASFFRINIDGAHRAAKDVQMTREVFLKLFKISDFNYEN